MSLAHVVYNISNDNDFAAKWNRDPQAALAGSGFKLTREEFNFLSAGLERGSKDELLKVRLSELVSMARSWR